MARSRKKSETLTSVLAKFTAKRLLPDLKKRSQLPAVAAALKAEHAAERARGVTGVAYLAWRDAWLEQVAAAWVLSCVFVRTLEDRGLLGVEVFHLRAGQQGWIDVRDLFLGDSRGVGGGDRARDNGGAGYLGSGTAEPGP